MATAQQRLEASLVHNSSHETFVLVRAAVLDRQCLCQECQSRRAKAGRSRQVRAEPRLVVTPDASSDRANRKPRERFNVKKPRQRPRRLRER